MLVQSPSLPLATGNGFPWGSAIVLTIVAVGAGYITYKIIEDKKQKNTNHERFD